MSERVFITGSDIAVQAHDYLEEQGCLLRIGRPADTPEDIALAIAGFRPHGLIVRSGRITADVLDAGPDLRVICKHGVGTDNIDIAAASERHIPVLFTPNANYEAVAEHSLALILALLRRIPRQDRLIRSGAYEKRGYDGIELRGKTLGLLGYGRVGRRLALLVKPFQPRIVAFDPTRDEAASTWVEMAPTPRDVFAVADILSIHCPLTSQTRGLVDGRAFSQMKRGVYVVNTARGAIVKERDLVAALRSGQVAGAALDVYEHEPPDLSGELFKLENVVVTPHIAGHSDTAALAMGMEAARHVLTVLRGQEIDLGCLVNPEVLDTARPHQ